MAGISSFTAGKSLTTDLIFGAANPKPIAVSLAAATTISAASLGVGITIATVAIYTLIGSVGVVAPLVIAIVMGTKSVSALYKWKAWLGENNAAVMSVLFLVIGVVIIGNGITGLTA